MRRFDQDVNAPGVQFDEATRKTPAHEYMLHMVFQALSIGLAAYIATFLICLGIDELSVRWAAIVGGLTILIILAINYFMQWKMELLWAWENITGRDWNQDGFKGEPQEARVVQIEISNPDNNNLQYLKIPEALFEKLPMIAHLLRAGKPFSEGAMCGSGRPLSRSEFHSLRDVLFDRGLATWRNAEHPTLGVILTARGKSVMRQAEELSTTPPRMHTPRQQNVLPAQSVGEWGER